MTFSSSDARAPNLPGVVRVGIRLLVGGKLGRIMADVPIVLNWSTSETGAEYVVTV